MLDLGFEEFVRVGSVRKMAKPVLPHSVHATGSDSQELRDLQDMLRADLTPAEKMCAKATWLLPVKMFTSTVRVVVVCMKEFEIEGFTSRTRRKVVV